MKKPMNSAAPIQQMVAKRRKALRASRMFRPWESQAIIAGSERGTSCYEVRERRDNGSSIRRLAPPVPPMPRLSRPRRSTIISPTCHAWLCRGQDRPAQEESTSIRAPKERRMLCLPMPWLGDVPTQKKASVYHVRLVSSLRINQGPRAHPGNGGQRHHADPGGLNH